MTLGSLLELPKALLGGLSTPKTLKTNSFAWFLGRHLFAALELLMALRGLSWHAQDRSGTQEGPKSYPKVVQKQVKNRSHNKSRKGNQNDPKMIPKIYSPKPDFRGLLVYYSGSWPRWPKMAPRWPKRVPRWPKTLLR